MFKKNMEFSKILLVQESLLIWIITIVFLVLAFYCITLGYLGSLPWLTAMVSLPWAAYGVSQAFYYSKSKAENSVGGIKYETIMAELNKVTVDVPGGVEILNYEVSSDGSYVDYQI